MSTLKQRHSLKELDKRLSGVSMLITEDLDRNTLIAAIDVIKRLNSIDLSAVPALDSARDEAVSTASDAAAGIDRRGTGTKILDLFRGQRSPFIDALALAAALRSFFPLLEKFVSAVASKDGAEAPGDVPLNQILNSERLVAGIRNVVEKGLKPDGRFARLSKDWRKRFLTASNDEIVDQIMDMSLQQVKDVTKAVAAATGAAPKVTDAVVKQASQQPRAAEPAKGQHNASPETGHRPVETPPRKGPTLDVKDDIVNTVRDRLGKGNPVPAKTIRQIVDILDDTYGLNRP